MQNQLSHTHIHTQRSCRQLDPDPRTDDIKRPVTQPSRESRRDTPDENAMEREAGGTALEPSPCLARLRRQKLLAGATPRHGPDDEPPTPSLRCRRAGDFKATQLHFTRDAASQTHTLDSPHLITNNWTFTR